MRKNRLFALLPLVLILLTTLVSGCDSSVIGKYEKQISDYRYIAMRYECDNYRMDIIGGTRELNYAADGVSDEEKVNYTVFTIYPKTDALGSSVNLKVTINTRAWQNEESFQLVL